MAALTLRGVRKIFDKTEVLHGIDLDVDDGEFVVFVGPSGCGKSTLLRVISGLETIDGGELQIGGEVVNNLSPRERGIAMVFQSYALYPHMSVYKNMAFGLKIDGMTADQIDQRIRAAAEKLQLDKLLDRKPGQLSGGQRQRVAIGRAIVRDPRVFLFDEPLSNLDAALRVQMRIEIARLQKSLNTTTIYVTHDQVEAMTLADKIVVLSEGKVEQVGAPMDLYHRPANTFVAGFIGSPAMNLMTCSVVAAEGNTAELSLGESRLKGVPQVGASAGDKVTLGVRPEHLSAQDNGGVAVSGELEAIERLGDITYLYLALADGTRVTVAEQGDRVLSMGDRVSVYAARDKLHLFNAEGQAMRVD